MTRRRKSGVVSARRAAHRTSVLLGDVRAVQTGRGVQRVANRVMGRGVAKIMRGKWF